MKLRKIIYGDGTVERGLFSDSMAARHHAHLQARQNNTIVGSQSIIGGRFPASRQNGR